MIKSILTILPFTLLSAGLIQPPNSSTLYHTIVQFEWEQIPNAEWYQIMVSPDENFSNNIIDTLASSLIYINKETIDWESQYYWRVRKHNPDGEPGPWSDVFTFTTAEKKSNVITTYSNVTQIADGFTIFGSFFNYYSAVIDKEGREIWNSGNTNLVFYNTNKDGDLFGCYLDNTSDNNLPGVEFDIDNKFLWEEPNVEFLHHDLIQLPNGNYLGIVSVGEIGPIPIGSWTSLFQGLGYVADGVTLEFPWIGDKIVEWDKDTKEVVWSWNTFDYFDMQDFDAQGGTWNQAYIDRQYDWTHVNAVAFDEVTSSVYISVRHLSRITCIDYPGGDVFWNMGHEFPSGDVDFGHDLGFSFQHSLHILENGNIVTFDNGNLSQIFLGTNEPTSRAIEIDVSDDSAYVAEIAWEYILPTDLFGFASGNVQKLDNGNYLITTVGGGGTTLEVDSSGEIVWQTNLNLTLPSGAVYRAMRIPGIYPVAFSIITQNLHYHESEPSVYLENSTVVFEIHNEGTNAVTYEYFLSDDEGWFDPGPDEITIGPGEYSIISYSSDEIINVSYANPMTFTVTPIDHPHLAKIVSVNGYTFPLSIDNEQIPNQFRLNNPFPNPFNAITTIQYDIPEQTNITLTVYNLLGRKVEVLINEKRPSGTHQIQWGASNVTSGIYFVKLVTPNQMIAKKVVVLK